MSNLISMELLKLYAPSLVNRGDSGEPKTVPIDNVPRARISSQCQKKKVRSASGLTSFRSSHLEELVEGMLLNHLNKGELTQDQFNTIGEAVCKAFNCKWEDRKSVRKDKKKKSPVVIVAHPDELEPVIAEAIKNKNKKADAITAAIQDVISNVPMPVDKAMFGAMITEGMLQQVDAAVYLGDTYSIDPFMPENDYGVVTFSSAPLDNADPFYSSCYKEFAKQESTKKGSDNIVSSWEYSNTMYTKTFVDLGILKSNLSMSSTLKDLNIPKKRLLENMQDAVCDYFMGLITTTPSAKQHGLLTNSFPAICLIQVLENGKSLTFADPKFQKPVKATSSKSVSEIGIERMLDHAKDNRASGFACGPKGKLRKYVLLDEQYSQYEKDFEDAGITVIHDVIEFVNILNAEIKTLSA